MKKIVFGIITILTVFIFVLGKHFTDNAEVTNAGNKMVMLAPGLDLDSAPEEDIALLIEIGWDLSGEVPSLTIREEDVDYEVQNGVVNLTELFEEMDQSIQETE